ncbi:MAG TPA: glycine betaine ABC transporter substrate-binding protein [Gemmataceae bacterium]|nr:glycine betaine ABC transporter substrate-binding protein [Gemmataceae bacterium]
MKIGKLLVLLVVLGCVSNVGALEPIPQVYVGSKAFTESVILGEIAADLARSTGAGVFHHQQLGSTMVVWKALLAAKIHVYVEYTGTISQEILAGGGLRDDEAVRKALAELGIRMSRPLGFNNTYAIGMRKDVAGRFGIQKVSDLRTHPELRFGFSNEFMERGDGWKGLRRHYQLPQKDVRGLDHELAYRGLVSGDLDATDVYSTDATIRRYDLLTLADDRNYFPAYQAVLLYRSDLEERAPDALRAILMMEGKFSEAMMVDLNARVQVKREPDSKVAAEFVRGTFGIQVVTESDEDGQLSRFFRLTLQHLRLVAVSLLGAMLIAIPLGILAARQPQLGQMVLGAAGILQTIPSLALLIFMVPLLGLGAQPAIAALFLYSLLPIIRNTHAGLHDVPLQIRESAEALGLTALARLRLIELPLAARAILAGIKTAAVINVGTATLGGFIAAGGYGELIFAGIRKDDMALTLQGAIPAAVLALLVQGLFELAERAVVPKGLRLKPAE